MGRAHCKSYVSLNLLDVFFKESMDLYGQQPGDQISDANGPYLHKDDRMKEIFLEPLNQGCHEHRNVIEVVRILHFNSIPGFACRPRKCAQSRGI